MARTWTQRREALLSDCIVSPHVFTPMIDRLAAFVVPYQQAMETEAAQRNMHLYLQGRNRKKRFCRVKAPFVMEATPTRQLSLPS
jgi:hypothetical protein